MRLIADYRQVVCLTLFFGLAGCAAQHGVASKPSPPAPPPPPDLHALYERAIVDAAVKRPSFVADLTPIVAGKPDVQLISLHPEGEPPIDPKTGIIARPLWSVLPDELKPKCRARQGDAVLVLEELLGMPPDATTPQPATWRLSLFSVSPKRVFRPCASSPDITTTSCSLEIEHANGSQADFVYHQTWSSYQIGADTTGYPFTGMGWTYDWGPDATSHIGLSEYVVRPGTRARKVQILTPEAFCRAEPGVSATTPDPAG